MNPMKLHICRLAALCALALAACNDDDPGAAAFDNRLFIDSESMTETTLLKEETSERTQLLTAAMAKPRSADVHLRYEAAPGKVATYNEAYYADAILLHAKYYEFAAHDDVIRAGGIRSEGVELRFRELELLDRDVLYVLPVTIARADIATVARSRTIYYVFRGASLIDVVGDIDGSFLWVPTWNDASRLNSLTQLTMEALIRVRSFDRPISTLMGIERHFLIRFGDSNHPGQIQVASSKRNFPPKDAAKVLPTNVWVHVAVTYDAGKNDLRIYVDGQLQSEGGFPDGPMGMVNLGKSLTVAQESETSRGFWIGRSYAPDRYLAGEIAECRIWSVVRTQEQIAAGIYRVDPASEGLAAYWKFDEGNGSRVKDHVAGNDLEGFDPAGAPMRWTQVALPEKEEK